VEKQYDEEKDILLYSDDPAVWFTVHPGTFVIFFPWDAHAPLVSNGIVHKIVAKVLL
jgi:beta-galactosidase beta subunit